MLLKFTFRGEKLMTKRIVVIGGGFAGQLVQLALPDARILDWRKEAPKDHLETRIGPQYLWAPIPGVESVSFDVITQIDGESPRPDRILAYKRKIGKERDGGDWGLQFQPTMRGWHSRLPVPRIDFNMRVQWIDVEHRCLRIADHDGLTEHSIYYDTLVSTIPLPALLDLCPMWRDWHRMTRTFQSDPIYMTVVHHMPFADAMILNYIADPTKTIYRMTSFQSDRYFESLSPMSPGARRILPGKIHPNPDSERIVSQLWDEFRVKCFGRFATWSPDELAHETWQQIVTWRDAL